MVLTVTGVFLMFFYRPTATQAWADIQTLETAVYFGSFVRNMHRWAAHLNGSFCVLTYGSCFLSWSVQSALENLTGLSELFF
jgi:quinol-cytochrome oxidoreductase complex cytochrome b subunit